MALYIVGGVILGVVALGLWTYYVSVAFVLKQGIPKARALAGVGVLVLAAAPLLVLWADAGMDADAISEARTQGKEQGLSDYVADSYAGIRESWQQLYGGEGVVLQETQAFPDTWVFTYADNGDEPTTALYVAGNWFQIQPNESLQ